MKLFLSITTRLLLSYILLTSIVFITASPSVALVVEDKSAPKGFRLIGVYRVESIVRVREGVPTQSAIKDTKYSVYSNLQEIRLYQADNFDSYHTYKIYRSDGITEQDAKGNIVVRPGIQASHTSNHTVKQISLTQDRLTITQLPPISDTVVICYAKRLAESELKR